MWFKEEQFNNHRILLWSVISKELYTLLIITAKEVKVVFIKFVKIQIGKIFCIVLIMSHIFHSIFSVIWKYHVLNGNKPNFIINTIFIRLLITFMLIFILCCVIIIIKIMALLTLWIRKYFIKLLYVLILYFECRGIKIIIFSSIVAHTISIFLEDKDK